MKEEVKVPPEPPDEYWEHYDEEQEEREPPAPDWDDEDEYLSDQEMDQIADDYFAYQDNLIEEKY